jgi:hypothetical protein
MKPELCFLMQVMPAKSRNQIYFNWTAQDNNSIFDYDKNGANYHRPFKFQNQLS